MARPIYEFSYRTESTDASPAALQGSTYWYETDTSGVYYDTSDTYAIWTSTTYGLIASVVADVDNEGVTDYFLLSGAFDGQGTWTGTITQSTYTLSTAWYDAETTCFDSLASFLGNTEGIDAFRGWIPINEEGNPKYSNCWELRTGGTGGGFDVSDTYGEDGAWCNAFIDAELHGIFEDRRKAMCFAGAVMAWLKSTNNMNQTDNVTWCQLADLPESPTELIPVNRVYWEVRIPLQILYLTESVHS